MDAAESGLAVTRIQGQVGSEAMIEDMLLSLGEAVWGRSWPTNRRQYELVQKRLIWYLRPSPALENGKSFEAYLQRDLNTGLSSFHIRYAGGCGHTSVLSRASIGSILKVAYRHGPRNQPTTSNAQRNQWSGKEMHLREADSKAAVA